MTNFKTAAKLAVLGASIVATSSAFALGQAQTKGFDVKLTLMDKIQITKTSDLTFPNQVQGEAADPAVAATNADTNSASFDLEGHDGATVSISVTGASITMTTGDGVGTTKQMTVDSFVIQHNDAAIPGGGLEMDGIGTPVTGVKVGATAHVEAEDIAGDYAGTNTLSVVYN